MAAAPGDARSPLLELPPPLLQRVLAAAGRGGGGAYRSCGALRSAWRAALTASPTAAALCVACFGTEDAAGRLYDTVLPYGICCRRDDDGGGACGGSETCLLRVLAALVSGGVPLTAHLGPLLAQAAAVGHAEVAAELVRLGADAAGGDGSNALMKAACSGHASTVRVLLAAGADPRGGRRGIPPLPYACASGNGEAVRLLLAAGAGAVGGCGNGGWQQLAAWAADVGLEEVAEVLRLSTC
ncbi:Histone-lysine N-methyltransferase EHMT1 [Tetrabaena socialis]|uniref:Histone-lysine N-methyltransferase EHMT1 n=1 Tax=Tetrabaena socialis TaxID=47790 RepID=A0A2J8AAN5_9CHLO|nr:Histone-lysine N-methyltransferase EHMT1 [Tetrabaena socialis]|eukprot:PNH09533.1 Histone-lysine N-methyltransferase EHMT1 [Tetrabaena socialis]